PDERGDCTNLAIVQTERRHLSALAPGMGILQPHRKPFLSQLDPNLLETRPDLLHLANQASRAHVELFNLGVEAAGTHLQIVGTLIEPLRFSVLLGFIDLLNAESGFANPLGLL